MEHKRDSPKTSSLDSKRRKFKRMKKLNRILKQHGFSQQEARSILNSSLISTERQPRIEKASTVIRNIMKSRDDNSQSNSSKSYSSCSSHSSKKSDENYSSSERYSFSKSGSVVPHYNDTEKSVEPEVERNAPVVLDTDESVYKHKTTRRTPINQGIVDHHTRRKRVIKMRSPEVATRTRRPSNELVDSYIFDDSSLGSTIESESSSESMISLDQDSIHHGNMYVSKGKVKGHRRSSLDVFSLRNAHRIRLNKRIKSRQNAMKFVMADVEPNDITTNDNPAMSPKRQQYPRRRELDVTVIPSDDSRGAVDAEEVITSLNCILESILNMANHNESGTIDLSTEVIEVTESTEDEETESISVNTESAGQATIMVDDLPSDVSSS